MGSHLVGFLSLYMGVKGCPVPGKSTVPGSAGVINIQCVGYAKTLQFCRCRHTPLQVVGITNRLAPSAAVVMLDVVVVLVVVVVVVPTFDS